MTRSSPVRSSLFFSLGDDFGAGVAAARSPPPNKSASPAAGFGVGDAAVRGERVSRVPA
ncbi:MAG: hypothetical protein H0X40_18905 [Chthoniobacterales bacterium]|nr:hypothetical protein [Chthoniobacterales bacterium]